MGRTDVKPVWTRSWPRLLAGLLAAVVSLTPLSTTHAHHESTDAWEASGHDGVKYLHMDGQVINIWHSVSGKLLRQGYNGRRDDKRNVEVNGGPRVACAVERGTGYDWLLRPAGEGYWYVINMTSGLYLSKDSNDNNVSNWGRTSSTDDNQKWQFVIDDQSVDLGWEDGFQTRKKRSFTIINKASGLPLTQHHGGRSEKENVNLYPKSPGASGFDWFLIQAPNGSGYDSCAGTLRSLRKLTIESVKAIKTSTGQDAGTKVLFAGIDLALSIGSGIAKAGAQAGGKAAASGGRAVTREAVKKAAREAAEKAARNIVSSKVKGKLQGAATEMALDAARSGGGGDNAGMQALDAVNEVLDALSSENVFNKVYGGSPDDLDIRVNGWSIWPNGGRSSGIGINSQQTLSVNAEFIFEHDRGVEIGLYDYDSASSDDLLGATSWRPARGLYSETDLARNGVERFENVLVSNGSEGSLYEITYRIEPLTSDVMSEGELNASARQKNLDQVKDAKVRLLEQERLKAEEAERLRTLKLVIADEMRANCALRGTVRSQPWVAVANATLQFHNIGAGKISIFWINADGQEVNTEGQPSPYLEMGPRTESSIGASSAGQYFIALDEQQNCVGLGDTGGGVTTFAFTTDAGPGPAPDPAVAAGSVPVNPAPVDPVAVTCDQRRSIVSPPGSEATTVDFSNSGSGELSIYWINGEGEEMDYAGAGTPLAVIAPGAVQSLQAYVGHAFVARDAQSACLGIARIAQGPNSFSYAATGGQAGANPAQPDPASAAPQTDPAIATAQTGPVAPVPQPATCDQRGSITSPPGSEATTVDFTNTGAGDLSVYWVDGVGAEMDYAGAMKPLVVVAPGATQSLQAYVGHAFVAVDSEESCLGIARIASGPNQFTYAPAGDGGALVPDDPSVAAATAGQNSVLGCESRGSIGSGSGGEPAVLTLRNSGSGDLRVFRIESDGSETDGQGANGPLTMAGAGQQTSFQASVGDAYLATDAAGNCLGIVQVLAPMEEFAFAPDAVADEAAVPGAPAVDPAQDVDMATGTENPQSAVADPEQTEPAVEVAQPVAGGGCELRGQIASSGSEAASVDIANVGSGAIAVYWINDQGGEGDYQNAPQPLLVIEPGASQSFDALIGFAFTVADVHGNCLGVAQVAQAANAFQYAGVE